MWVLLVILMTPLRADMETLLSSSCLDCHDDLSEKGGLSLESIDSDINGANAEIWKKCLEQIERGFMPPAEKTQPSPDLKNAAILDLEERLVNHYQSQPAEGRQTVLRRLNRVEYRNTISDLLKLELGRDPTTDFPGDERSHGFATNGEKLVTSNFLLRRYLEAAEGIVSQAVHFRPRPETQQWKMKPPFDRSTQAEIQQAAAYYRKTEQVQPYQDICGRIGAGGAPFSGYHPLDDLSAEGVPESGLYSIKMLVEGKYRHSLKYEHFVRFKPLWDGSEPIRLSLSTATLQGIDPLNKEVRRFAATHEQKNQTEIATWDLPDDEKIWLEVKVWLEKGQFPRLGFPNGPTNSNHRIQSYFDELAKQTYTPDALAEHLERKQKYGGWSSFVFFESPRIRLHEIEVEGPLNEVWPPESHRTIFGDDKYQPEKAGEVLQNFASKAWRRPVAKGEIEPILSLVKATEKDGATPEEAIQEGIKAILCSPGFIYLEERNESLNDYELAARLSYFLTASQPDRQLADKAARGEVGGSLADEAKRILSSPVSDSFVNEFLDGWLQLNKLGSMAPDPHRFSVYYNDRLEPAMRRETRSYFRYLLDTNRPVKEFLDSDYTFANEELAALYGIKADEFAAQRNNPVEGLPERYLRQDGKGDSPTMRYAKVKLEDRRRGGLLGQAGILTLTANGVDTSPVIRGVWLLENILGTPPSPPPPGVPAIEPDIRGAKTIREQLEKHRDAKACRSCHAHIDPPGFALESFDPIGKWRGHYRVDTKYIEIDSTGSFGDVKFSDITEFKAELLKREDAFARCVVEKLLLHALGRELTVTDRPSIRAILEKTRKDGYRLQDLVIAVVESEIFSRK
ncbi:MAG: DUF1592 domain-containing protein [Verrucomicrobiales bacterium]|nr:DUF1592 domain-containing protein [Verrucomicrobiales bacterium]